MFDTLIRTIREVVQWVGLSKVESIEIIDENTAIVVIYQLSRQSNESTSCAHDIILLHYDAIDHMLTIIPTVFNTHE